MWWFAVLGCTGPLTGSFLGELAAPEGVRIAVALEETRVSVFFAGSDESLATHTRYFEGARTEEDTFQATTDGWGLSGHVEGEGILGDLTDPDGLVTPWNVGPTIDASILDGLWAAEEGEGACRAAVVLYNSEFNLQGGYCPAEGEVVPVTPVDLDTGDKVIDLQAEAATGPIPFQARPVFPIEE